MISRIIKVFCPPNVIVAYSMMFTLLKKQGWWTNMRSRTSMSEQEDSKRQKPAPCETLTSTTEFLYAGKVEAVTNGDLKQFADIPLC